MSDPNNELLQKVQQVQPLFKTEELNEQAFKQQDVFKEQQQFQTAQTEATKEAHEEQLANTFKVEEAEKIKEDGDDPQEPAPEYISLHYSGISITAADDKKMIAIKKAVEFYRNSIDDVDEGMSLEAVIKACNSYTWGKFSLFCSGKTKAKLKEVKRLRQDAQKALAEFKKKETESNKELIKSDEEYYAGRIQRAIYDSDVDYPNDLTKAHEEKLVSDRAKDIQKRYHFNAARAMDVARQEFEEGVQLSHSGFKNRFMTKEEKMIFEVDEEVEKRLHDMNSVKRFFARIFTKESIKIQVMKERIKQIKFENGIRDEDKVDLSFSRNDGDYERTFV